MGEEKEDPQKLKRIAATAYEYDKDPRWADYWSNILIPPNMASSSDVQDHFKRKFYQRFIVPSLSLSLIWVFFFCWKFEILTINPIWVFYVLHCLWIIMSMYVFFLSKEMLSWVVLMTCKM